MDRKSVEDILNLQLKTSMCFTPLDEFYEDFKTWLKAIENDGKEILKGKSTGLLMPTTPAASRGLQRRLSVIRESPAGIGIQQTSKPHLELSKNTIAENGLSLKTKQLSRTKSKLTFHCSEDENDDHGSVESHGSLKNSSSQDSLKTSAAISQTFNTGSSEQCFAEVQEKTGVKNEKISKSQSEHCNEKEIKVIGSQRHTRSSVKTSQNVSCGTDQHVVDMSLPVSQSSISETEELRSRVLVDEKQSISKRNRRTKNPSVVSNKKRITNSRRNTRSKAKVSLQTVNSSSSAHPVDVSPAISRISVSESENTDEVPVVKKLSTAGKKGRLKKHSSVRSKTRVTGTKRMTRSNVGALNSLSSGGLVSLIERENSSLHDAEEKVEKLSSNKNCTDVEKRSLQNIDKAKISTSSNDVIDNVSSDSTYIQKINNSWQVHTNKELVIRLTRVGEKTGNSSRSAKISDEVHKNTDCNASNTFKKSANKISEEIEKILTEEISDSVGRKRNLSCFDTDRPSKRSRLCEKDTNIAENDIRDQIRSSQRLSLQQKKRISSSALPEKKIKKSSVHNEVKSFSEISSPSSILNPNKNLTFEGLVGEDYYKNKENTNDKADSGKGNSTDSEVECSEYYSVGSKVDTVDLVHGSQENAKSCLNPVRTSRSERKQSLRKQADEPAIKPNTPDTRSSRKGAHAALFSPYANEPVKNRVAAYEVLSSVMEEAEIPITTKRVTRTKTRAMAAAAAAGVSNQKHLVNNCNTKSGRAQKVTRASMLRAKRKLAVAAKGNDASKENSFNSSAKSAISGKHYNFTPLTGGKILGDVNGLSSSQLNSSRKTPMTVSKMFAPSSGNQSNKSTHKAGVILCNVDTFIKRNMKPDVDPEVKKLEEQKKREEKEREAQRRREEFLKTQAEEKKRKRDELRQRVQEKREAQEKQKQESQLRVGREKDEKWNILQQEREAKQKGNLLKKKLEAEKKAAEARRKAEEAEAARLHKMKLEEQHRLKELEEAEKERHRRIAEEKEAVILREKLDHMIKKTAEVKEINKHINVSNSQSEDPDSNAFKKPLNTTFTKALDSTFTKPLNSSSNESHNTTFNPPLPEKKKTHSKLNNAYNLEDLPSDESDDEADDPPKKVAHWASKSRMLWCTKFENNLIKSTFFCPPTTINFSEIFHHKRALKRSSSAIWNTPPRYSCLPKY